MSLVFQYFQNFKYWALFDAEIWHHISDMVLFENKPALYFCNYIVITACKIYIFWFRIKDTV